MIWMKSYSAVMACEPIRITRSPLPSPAVRRQAAMQPSLSSLADSWCGTSTGSTPQDSCIWRSVFSSSVQAMIRQFGRMAETSRAVRPECVVTTMAAAPMCSAV